VCPWTKHPPPSLLHFFVCFQEAKDAATPGDQFRLFFTDEMLERILIYTNEKIAEIHEVREIFRAIMWGRFHFF
jgi:hypothetical protein